MKKLKPIMIIMLCITSTQQIFSTINNFGISDILPTKSDDNEAFDQRIAEEMLGGQQLVMHGRHVTNLKIQHILDFIPKVDAYFESLLNTQNHDPRALRIAQIAIIDIQKAKKMLRPQDVSADEEHDLRLALQALTTKINGYTHTDNVEEDEYLRK